MRYLKDYTSDIRNGKRETWAIEFLIAGFLLTSSIQMAIAFGGSTTDYIKALMFDGFVIIVSRSISRSHSMLITTVLLWTSLITVMTISCSANLKYEYMEVAKQFAIDGIPLTFWDKMFIWAESGFLPVIILSITLVRAVYLKDIRFMERDQDRLERRRRNDARRKEKETLPIHGETEHRCPNCNAADFNTTCIICGHSLIVEELDRGQRKAQSSPTDDAKTPPPT